MIQELMEKIAVKAPYAVFYAFACFCSGGTCHEKAKKCKLCSLQPILFSSERDRLPTTPR